MPFNRLLSAGLASLNITPTAKQLELLARYASNMFSEGETRGLTALKDPEKLARELIIDAVSAVPLLREAAHIADLGSGGGTPGLPLAIMLENSRFTLVESNQRKARWIAEQIADLQLQDRVSVSTKRIEELGRDSAYRQRCDAVVAKALAALPALVELAVPLLRVQGQLCAYKGSKFAQEIADSQRALRELRAQVHSVYHYSLEGMDRVIVQIVKLQDTPKIYPRRIGLPQHSPL
ncbi:MAG: 16S rRNA (guanine(527)-N(7))-methyltransferase RsmG [bacterium]|nr:16S rRNA (guanine(527)-N(7))-methyltransferase RsmG [bacterium]